MANNTLSFLLSAIKLLKEANFFVWVFGGWAEELWQITPKRIHNDIDFLYPAATFECLDRFIAQAKDFQEIPAKRFSHKRAILYQNVMIEFLLVQSTGWNHFTDFFSGRYHLAWPTDAFWHRMNIAECDIQIASKHALALYREHHNQIEQIYQKVLVAR